MSAEIRDRFVRSLSQLDAGSPEYVSRFIDLMLQAGFQAQASDLHLMPTADGIDLRWRIDGVLVYVGTWPKQIAPNLVARLKVLADLLTYRTEIPQEGRIQQTPEGVEMRLSTFPTLHGEKAVIRIFSGAKQLLRLEELGFPSDIAQSIDRTLDSTAGILLITGPAGSGKTTTVYACLREIFARTAGGRSLASLEDPIEAAIPGVAQSQVNPAAGFDLATALRSILRQDPEVILVGEIRDAEVAQGVFQASLTGHLVLTTFHAGRAAEAISRLSEMGIESYLLRSGIRAIVSQRLVRKLCSCKRPGDSEADKLNLDVSECWVPTGCPQCWGTGYRGRKLLAEMLHGDHSQLGRAILSRSDWARLERLAVQAGMTTLWHRALDAIRTGQTSPAEIRRTLGFTNSDSNKEF